VFLFRRGGHLFSETAFPLLVIGGWLRRGEANPHLAGGRWGFATLGGKWDFVFTSSPVWRASKCFILIHKFNLFDEGLMIRWKRKVTFLD
jgi:hypothetical protein